jgi:hypothetical protein
MTRRFGPAAKVINVSSQKSALNGIELQVGPNAQNPAAILGVAAQEPQHPIDRTWQQAVARLDAFWTLCANEVARRTASCALLE